ncbi:unnamed protein product, partial [Iphiclides podalirius]
MSGYLEVKYPFKSNLGLNPFKSWKRQWCILRPSATCGGGSLAVYCSEAGAPAGTVELPSGCVVKRAKSRTRPHAFAVFSVDEPCKPRVLLAAPSLNDAQIWMDKIRNILNTDKLLGDSLLNGTYSVTVLTTELSRKCGLGGVDCTVSLSGAGLLVAKPRLAALLPWEHLADARLSDDGGGTCVLVMDSGFRHGGGVVEMSSPQAGELAAAVRGALRPAPTSPPTPTPTTPPTPTPRSKFSRSEGDLRPRAGDDAEEIRRTSWYSGPSEVSLDDTDLIMSKETRMIPGGPLALRARALLHLAPFANCRESSDRRSVASVASAASGVYEEISEEGGGAREEPTYESVAECVYATVRRGRRAPPPLPPRRPPVARHGSLGSLPLPKPRQPFSVFRKRLKSDSRTAGSPKCDAAKEPKDVETKKKRFDFPPTRDIFKSFKVGRRMRGLKISSLAKGEAKSCEFLDEETRRSADARCSKSAECLDGELAELGALGAADELGALALPAEIVELILRGQERRQQPEGDYVPMSPIVPPPPIEHHYIVMSPRAHVASSTH